MWASQNAYTKQSFTFRYDVFLITLCVFACILHAYIQWLLWFTWLAQSCLKKPLTIAEAVFITGNVPLLSPSCHCPSNEGRSLLYCSLNNSVDCVLWWWYKHGRCVYLCASCGGQDLVLVCQKHPVPWMVTKSTWRCTMCWVMCRVLFTRLVVRTGKNLSWQSRCIFQIDVMMVIIHCMLSSYLCCFAYLVNNNAEDNLSTAVFMAEPLQGFTWFIRWIQNSAMYCQIVLLAAVSH